VNLVRRLARSIALRVAVLAAAVLVALPASAFSFDLFKCRYSGRVMSACCCAAKAKAEAAARAERAKVPEVKAASCCDVLHQEARQAPATPRDVDAGLPFATRPSTLALVVPPPARLISVRAARTQVLARAGPAIFLRDCRLLA
jgi:hypothetical protein